MVAYKLTKLGYLLPQLSFGFHPCKKKGIKIKVARLQAKLFCCHFPKIKLDVRIQMFLN